MFKIIYVGCMQLLETNRVPDKQVKSSFGQFRLHLWAVIQAVGHNPTGGNAEGELPKPRQEKRSNKGPTQNLLHEEELTND